MNIGVLLKFRRREESFWADDAFERSVGGIRVHLLVDFQTAFRFIELQALIALKVPRFTVEVLVSKEVRFLEKAFITLRAVVVSV